MTKLHNDYYTYAYLREDKTPYYIGKGRGKRIYSKDRAIKPPKDKSRILFLKKNLTEAEAFKHEVYMIFILGRKDLGTGILRNRTSGGEGASGAVHSDEQRKAQSKRMSGENNPMFGIPQTNGHKEKISKANTGKYAGEKNPQYGRTGALHHNSKAIIAIKPDGSEEYFGSIREAARELEINQSNLGRHLRIGHVPTKGKFKDWQFLFKNSEIFNDKNDH